MTLKYKIGFVFVFFSSLCLGQYNNPFEIKNRLDSLFEVSNKSTNSDLNSITSTDVSREDTSIVEEVTPQLFTSTSNPFDVSHVPIRKSELQKTSVIKQMRQGPDKSPTSNSGSNLIIFGVAILSLLLVAIVANVKRSIFTKVFKSFTNDNMLKLTQREENNGLNAGFLILYIIYAINAASLIYLLLQKDRDIQVKIWLLILIIVAVIYIIRHVSMYILGLIFPVYKESLQYSFLIAIVNILLGLVLIPVNLIIAYAPESLAVAMTYSVIGIVGFAFIIRSVKGLLIGLINYGAYIFHFFLYLCTFEIVPVLLIYRVFTNISA